MKIIITEKQYKIISEQVGFRGPTPIYGNPIEALKDHTINTILQIGTAFIPFIGPFISAGIGIADAKLYYDEGDKTGAGLTAAFSMLPFLGSVVSKIPGVKKLGTKGMAYLANKILKGEALNKSEIEIAKAIKNFQPQIVDDLTKAAPKLKKIIKQVEMYKPNFVKKYGEQEYNLELARYLLRDSPNAASEFITKLKSVKAPNIKIKPIMGGGADHRVFVSKLNPNVIFKAEVRPGEVNKWYDTFRKYPDTFAKTIKKTKVRDKDGTLLDAVVMEKLDTKKFESLWTSLEKTLQQFPKNESSTLEYLVKHIKEPNYMKIYNQVLSTAKKQIPSMKTKIDEFNKMVDQLYKITPSPDIRKFNLGYDSSGLLKALDI